MMVMSHPATATVAAGAPVRGMLCVGAGEADGDRLGRGVRAWGAESPSVVWVMTVMT